MRRTLALVLAVSACAADSSTPEAPAAAPPPCGGFDWPVGPPDASGYYDAQPFGDNAHLGEDWNGLGGGDSDLGHPVHAIADGIVSAAADEGGGWGNVVRIAHECGERPGARVESLYAHLDRIDIVPGAVVLRGQPIGTIGTAGGQYLAHLHLELRAIVGAPLGEGYGERPGYLAPSDFIARHRPR
ncbi:MAG: M23 family metallopeptidase [Myxococcales bacterium]|nr:M23 family metallopeptidase [Myxococcales bacterium]